MSIQKRSAAVLLAFLSAAIPALGQTTPSGSVPDARSATKPQGVAQNPPHRAINPSTSARKQNTQGLPPNMAPQDGDSNSNQSQGQAYKQ